MKLNTVSYIFDELRNLAKKDKSLLRYTKVVATNWKQNMADDLIAQ